ncbi:hypothetical protein OOT33_06050 [Sphingobium sp. DEHP117]|uniref:hypothetical protein n=1 Tax=Sphingobium sp. DEHP117 TaxID=2993436 RepID=UPI0027D70CFD|nr:hypothetical protein [Sphingobium sp. DEHP117]MDQ4420002.1 hypothetical protein [Sphingobium sp. DEHP117]
MKHIGSRKGQTSQVVLRPYKKAGAYKVAKSGAGNETHAEILCHDLDEVAKYVESGGYLVRMKSTKPKAEGLYASDDIKVVR